MSKDTLYSVISTIAYSICFVLLVVCVTVFVQYLRTGFTNPKVPAEGIVFEQETLLITQENLESASLTISPTNVLTEEQIAAHTEVLDKEIRLRINNGDVVKFVEGENQVTEIVTHFGTPVKLAVMMNEQDGLPVGGTCKVSAYCTDGSFMAKKDLVINVDVPIQDMNVIIKDKNHKDVTEDVENENIKFIKGDVLYFSVETIPARARKPYVAAIEKTPFFIGNIQSDRWAVLDSIGVLEVNGDDDQITGNISLTAKMLKSYDLDESDDENYIIKNFSVVTTRKTLSQIEIRNTNYDDVDNERLDIYVGESQKVRVSARETGLNDVINLNMFLKPTYYTEGDDPYYSTLTSLSLSPSIESLRTPDLDLLYIQTDIVDDVNNHEELLTNIMWTICVNRDLEAGENVMLQFSLTNETVTRYLKIAIHEALPTSGTIKGDDVEFTLVKATRNDGTEYVDTGASSALKYEQDLTDYLDFSMDVDIPLTYTKFVYFLKDATEERPWINGVGSPIVNISEAGQIKLGTGSSALYSDTIEAKGSGEIAIEAFLVLTNENGQPIDCNYHIISGAAQETARAVSRDKIRAEAPSSYTDYAGHYVFVAATAQPFMVTVKEKLTSLKFTHELPRFDNEGHIIYEGDVMQTEIQDVGNVLEMGAGADNAKPVFVAANSMYALLDNWKDFVVEEPDDNSFSVRFDKNNASQMLVLQTDVETNFWTAVQLRVVITADASKTENNDGVNTVRFVLDTLEFPLQLKAYNVLIDAISFDYEFTQNANGDNYLELTGAVEDISGDGQNSLWAINWYDSAEADSPYSALPNAVYSVSQTNISKGFLHPSTPSSNPLVYLVSNAELAACREDSSIWSDPSTMNYDFSTNDFTIGTILDENNRQVGKQFLVKNLNYDTSKNIVISYVASDVEGSPVANYFVINLIAPQFSFNTQIVDSTVIDSEDGSFLFERRQQGNLVVYPTASDDGLNMNRVVFDFGERQATTALTLKIDDRLSPAEGEEASADYTIRENDVNTLWYFVVSSAQRQFFTSDSTEESPRGSQGQVIHLANGKIAYTTNAHGGTQIKFIYVTAEMKFFLSGVNEDVGGVMQTVNYYYTAKRDIKICWGPRSDTNGYYVATQ